MGCNQKQPIVVDMEIQSVIPTLPKQKKLIIRLRRVGGRNGAGGDGIGLTVTRGDPRRLASSM